MEDIEYLEEYADMVLPNIQQRGEGNAGSDDDSSSIDQDIFESIFEDPSSDDEQMAENEKVLMLKRQGRLSIDSLDLLAKDLSGPLTLGRNQEAKPKIVVQKKVDATGETVGVLQKKPETAEKDKNNTTTTTTKNDNSMKTIATVRPTFKNEPKLIKSTTTTTTTNATRPIIINKKPVNNLNVTTTTEKQVPASASASASTARSQTPMKPSTSSGFGIRSQPMKNASYMNEIKQYMERKKKFNRTDDPMDSDSDSFDSDITDNLSNLLDDSDDASDFDDDDFYEMDDFDSDISDDEPSNSSLSNKNPMILSKLLQENKTSTSYDGYKSKDALRLKTVNNNNKNLENKRITIKTNVQKEVAAVKKATGTKIEIKKPIAIVKKDAIDNSMESVFEKIFDEIDPQPPTPLMKVEEKKQQANENEKNKSAKIEIKMPINSSMNQTTSEKNAACKNQEKEISASVDKHAEKQNEKSDTKILEKKLPEKIVIAKKTQETKKDTEKIVVEKKYENAKDQEKLVIGNKAEDRKEPEKKLIEVKEPITTKTDNEKIVNNAREQKSTESKDKKETALETNRAKKLTVFETLKTRLEDYKKRNSEQTAENLKKAKEYVNKEKLKNDDKGKNEKIADTKQKNEKVEDTKQKNEKVEDTKQKNDKVENTKQKDEKVEDTKQKNEKVKDTKQKNDKVADTKQKNEKIEDTKQKNEKVADTKQKNEKIEDTKQKSEKVADTIVMPKEKAKENKDLAVILPKLNVEMNKKSEKQTENQEEINKIVKDVSQEVEKTEIHKTNKIENKQISSNMNEIKCDSPSTQNLIEMEAKRQVIVNSMKARIDNLEKKIKEIDGPTEEQETTSISRDSTPNSMDKRRKRKQAPETLEANRKRQRLAQKEQAPETSIRGACKTSKPKENENEIEVKAEETTNTAIPTNLDKPTKETEKPSTSKLSSALHTKSSKEDLHKSVLLKRASTDSSLNSSLISEIEHEMVVEKRKSPRLTANTKDNRSNEQMKNRASQLKGSPRKKSTPNELMANFVRKDECKIKLQAPAPSTAVNFSPPKLPPRKTRGKRYANNTPTSSVNVGKKPIIKAKEKYAGNWFDCVVKVDRDFVEKYMKQEEKKKTSPEQLKVKSQQKKVTFSTETTVYNPSEAQRRTATTTTTTTTTTTNENKTPLDSKKTLNPRSINSACPQVFTIPLHYRRAPETRMVNSRNRSSTESAESISPERPQVLPTVNAIITTPTISATSESSTNTNLHGKCIYTFFQPRTEQTSLLLDYCCPNIDPLVPGLMHTPKKFPSQHEVLELPAYIAMETKIITRADLEQSRNAIPPSVKSRVDELTAQAMKNAGVNGFCQESLLVRQALVGMDELLTRNVNLLSMKTGGDRQKAIQEIIETENLKHDDVLMAKSILQKYVTALSKIRFQNKGIIATKPVTVINNRPTTASLAGMRVQSQVGAPTKVLRIPIASAEMAPLPQPPPSAPPKTTNARGRQSLPIESNTTKQMQPTVNKPASTYTRRATLGTPSTSVHEIVPQLEKRSIIVTRRNVANTSSSSSINLPSTSKTQVKKVLVINKASDTEEGMDAETILPDFVREGNMPVVKNEKIDDDFIG